jgi:carbamoyltransferase
MKVIGISPLDKDSTVTLVENGEITYAAAEERFTRVKLQDGFPWRAMADALETTGTQPAEIDAVIYPFLTWQEETRLFEQNLANEREFLDDADLFESNAQLKAARMKIPERTAQIPGLRHPNERMDKGLAKTLAYRVLANESVVSRNVAKRGSSRWGREASAFHRKWHEELESALDDLGLLGKLKRIEHHASHAANAYYTSGFDDALVVTLDGYGSGLAGSVGIGRNGTIERIHCVQYPHSLGTFYETVTSALGFQPSRHEGKIVGLAAYGDPGILRDVLLSRFQQEEGAFRNFQRSMSRQPINTSSSWSRARTWATTCGRQG